MRIYSILSYRSGKVGLEQIKLIIQKPLGKIEPLLTLALMIMRFPTMRLVAQMVMMPSQYESINNGLGHEVKQLGMNRFDLLKRDQEIIKMRPNRFENVRQLGILNLFDQAEDSHQL